MRWVKMLCIAALFWAAAQFCHSQTDGFSLSKVACYLPNSSDPIPLSHELNINQPFEYLTKGGQCYVFISRDKKIVLKLFRSSRLSFFSLIPSLFPNALAKEQSKLEEALNSASLAATSLCEETGLLYAHLGSQTSPLPPLKIIDKLQIKHTIDPMHTPFLLQKRAIPVKKALLTWQKQGDLESAKKGILSLIELIKTERAKGIGDSDPNLTKNFGFLGSRAMQIDVGRFGKTSQSSLAGSKEDLQHFINAHIPDLSTFFHEAFQPLIDKDEEFFPAH